ncbi:choice-of-anchor K domain-containing protein [Lusitaniella coriacea LEGE 07157]|uniref:Choice-of-anchor K domain-containing protein n=1 Tax=Lusitaniella coriacea LEGE 07157 TaxID=945747 RepID=A0A8J7E038_9CYAN|nr:choice-of-anchor K domain-containing protein [Lusitaniella coriacea]MBE9118956.1 choice-of-anchor K domain-containing protein [Lusitaniella coriacea LEGE 07157]
MYGNPNSKLALILSTTILSAFFSLFPTSVRAIALNRVSGIWSNVIGDENTIELQTVGDESQVRWGIPLGNGKSGLGFTGIGATELNIGDPFIIGTLRHFNNPITLPATSADLTLELEFSDPLLTQFFTFSLDIDETPNVEPCQYFGTSTCPDLIQFSPASMLTSLQLERTNYTLNFLGFWTSFEESPIVQIISEELSSSPTQAYLIGKIKPNSPSVGVPEPKTLFGFFFVGFYFLRSRDRFGRK